MDKKVVPKNGGLYMDEIDIKAYAKINLAIDLLGKREDDYNEVKMIMQTIDIFDKINIRRESEGIVIESEMNLMPKDNRNVAYKAAQCMLEKYNIRDGVRINIGKNIPISAGLGGGSADAAATMIGINKLFGLKLSTATLMELGKDIGADVPFCIMKNTALAEGIGEKLTALPNMKSTDLVVIKPRFGVSTKTVYEEFDYSESKRRPDFDFLITAISNNDIAGIANNMVNVLESVTERKNPIITDIKNQLMRNNALGAMMSGSGPAVFAIFKNETLAKNAYEVLRNKGGCYCYLTKTICFM